jgi:2-oxoglutarate ferredoxin oxidoreductase subunit beta
VSVAAGATYVARGAVAAPVQLDKIIKAGIQHEGFSVVEVLSNCHINWGRKNEHPDPYENAQWMKNALSTFNKDEAEKTGKFFLGEIHKDTSRSEYTHLYQTQVVAKAKEKKAKREAAKQST